LIPQVTQKEMPDTKDRWYKPEKLESLVIHTRLTICGAGVPADLTEHE